MSRILEHKSYLYAKGAMTDKRVPFYVKKQCKEFVDICENKDGKYFIDEDMLTLVENLTKIMNMATGLSTDMTVYEALVGFQWLLIVAIFCVKHRDDPSKRRYEEILLFISRKNGKSAIIGWVFALLLLLEPKFSEAYSVAPDGSLSRIVKKELEQLIKSSPALEKHFKIKRDDITCTLKESIYVPLNYSTSRLDGRKANFWLADEVGALPEIYPIEAMRSSQINMKNRLGVMVSTAYPTVSNPMVDECEYSKKVLDGVIDDEKRFSLIYEPDEDIRKEWKTNDLCIYQSNPLTIELKENFDFIVQQRQMAIEKPSGESNFLCKHLNIFVNSDDKEKYLNFNEWKKCKIPLDEFKERVKGHEVAISLDLSVSVDLTAVGIMFRENGQYYCHSHAFLPKDTLSERQEKIDYYAMERFGYCTLCDGMTVNYSQVERYIRDIESNFGCKIKAIISDPFNAKQMLESLSNDYEVIELMQRFSTLSTPTKEFRNEVYNGNVHYAENKLLDWNVSNATLRVGQVEDVMLNKRYKNKERIDMLAVLVFCFKVLFEEEQPINWDEIVNDDWII